MSCLDPLHAAEAHVFAAHIVGRMQDLIDHARRVHHASGEHATRAMQTAVLRRATTDLTDEERGWILVLTIRELAGDRRDGRQEVGCG